MKLPDPSRLALGPGDRSNSGMVRLICRDCGESVVLDSPTLDEIHTEWITHRKDQGFHPRVP